VAPIHTEIRLIGLDLDNTVIDYSLAYRELASLFELSEECNTREQIRAKLRRSSDDDEEWQRFQTLLYTDGLEFATPAHGLLELLEACRMMGVRVAIISHKTAAGPARFGGRDLRSPSLKWLSHHRITPGLVPNAGVSFHTSASEKVARIAQLRPTLFVDDLEEILLHCDFPSGVERILYSNASPWVESHRGLWRAGFPAITKWLRE